MKHNKYPQDQKQASADTSLTLAAANSSENAMNFVASPDEVARRAYFNYQNEGSLPGRDVQHWLAAEAQLLAERNLTRTHGFHNQT